MRSSDAIGRFFLRPILSLFLTVSVFSLFGCASPIYLAKLGWGQAKIVVYSRSNTKVLDDPAVDESIKEKIRLVLDAKNYGEREIGLARTSNFLRFYPVEGPSLLYVVSASRKDRLESYQWWFPITGTVTAKGFFDYEDAAGEKDRLQGKGLDVFIQGARAYSTLGWLKDPIFSTMIDLDSAMIANVVIHELTHATVFFKNRLDFNEEIATFVGGQGAIDFAGARFGEGSFAQKQARGFVQDSILFATFIKQVYQRLDDLYASPLPLTEKLRERESVFLQAKNEYRAMKERFETDFYLGFEALKLDNAVILALGRYIANIEQIQQVHEKLGRDLRRTVAFFKEIEDSGTKKPQEYLGNWLKKQGVEESSDRR
jgi:predicted aminopeptidase